MNTTHPKPTASIALATALALALTSASVLPAAAQGACLDNRQIQEAVASGEILSLDQVLASAGVDGSQSILNVQVCDQGGQLVYVVGVLSDSGEAENLTLSAR
jgi:hypothetical protein